MSDERLRRLERAALAEGDPEALDRLLRMRHRAGTLEQNRLYLLAALGVPTARDLIRHPPPLLSAEGNLLASSGLVGDQPSWAPWKKAFRTTGRAVQVRVVDALTRAWLPDWEQQLPAHRRLIGEVLAWEAEPSRDTRERIRLCWDRTSNRFRDSLWQLKPREQVLRVKARVVLDDPLAALRETLWCVGVTLPLQYLEKRRALDPGRVLELTRNTMLHNTLRPELPSPRRPG